MYCCRARRRYMWARKKKRRQRKKTVTVTNKLRHADWLLRLPAVFSRNVSRVTQQARGKGGGGASEELQRYKHLFSSLTRAWRMLGRKEGDRNRRNREWRKKKEDKRKGEDIAQWGLRSYVRKKKLFMLLTRTNQRVFFACFAMTHKTGCFLNKWLPTVGKNLKVAPNSVCPELASCLNSTIDASY